jgi:hypothetical protein
MIALRPFSELDWFGFSGAESFADGSVPLIGTLAVDGDEATVVLDAHGLSLMWVFDEGDRLVDHEVCFYTDDAARALALLPSTGTSLTVLLALGGDHK